MITAHDLKKINPFDFKCPPDCPQCKEDKQKSKGAHSPLESDKRTPKLMKIGCYTNGNQQGFTFFNKETKVADGDVYIYNKGVLWRLKND